MRKRSELRIMGKVILYLAMSLDGYIADRQGNYDFLHGYDDPESYDFQGFLNRLGTIIMGRKSYDLVKQQSSTWEYDNFQTYVYSKTLNQHTNNITFTTKKPSELIKEINVQSDKDIWLFGGSEIIDLFVKDRAIDEYWIYYVAEVLGSGIPLFKTPILHELDVKSIQQFGNIVEMKLIPKSK